MILTLHAQPYDTSANGFYFDSYDDYAAKVAKAVNARGQQVEEFEIQFIDGDDLDCALAYAIGLSQCNTDAYFTACEAWDDTDKLRVTLAVGECGYSFEATRCPEDFDLDIYEDMSLRDLAEQFVEEGLFGEVPERFSYYLDYDEIARDLGADYTEATIAGQRLVYRCA